MKYATEAKRKRKDKQRKARKLRKQAEQARMSGDAKKAARAYADVDLLEAEEQGG
jgi:hypothetical protein